MAVENNDTMKQRMENIGRFQFIPMYPIFRNMWKEFSGTVEVLEFLMYKEQLRCSFYKKSVTEGFHATSSQASTYLGISDRTYSRHIKNLEKGIKSKKGGFDMPSLLTVEDNPIAGLPKLFFLKNSVISNCIDVFERMMFDSLEEQYMHDSDMYYLLKKEHRGEHPQGARIATRKRKEKRQKSGDSNEGVPLTTCRGYHCQLVGGTTDNLSPHILIYNNTLKINVQEDIVVFLKSSLRSASSKDHGASISVIGKIDFLSTKNKQENNISPCKKEVSDILIENTFIEKEDSNMLFQNTNKKKSKKQPVKTYSACQYSLFDHWVKSGGVKHKPQTNTYDNAMIALQSAMDGNLFADNSDFPQFQNKKFTKKEIEQAITNFAVVLKDPSVQPTNKKYVKGLSLGAFLYNPNASTHTSWFTELFDQEPPKVECGHAAKVVYRDFPDLTYVEYLKDFVKCRELGIHFGEYCEEYLDHKNYFADTYNDAVYRDDNGYWRFRDAITPYFDDEGLPLGDSDLEVFINLICYLEEEGYSMNPMFVTWEDYWNGIKNSWVCKQPRTDTTGFKKVNRAVLFSKKTWTNKDVLLSMKGQNCFA